MGKTVVKPEEVEKAILKALAEYGDEASAKAQGLCKDSARETRRELKASAPTGGDYARGWSQRMVGGGAYKTTAVVFNRKASLVHLLEKPHRTGRYKGGSYPSKVDYTGTMERIEEANVQKFYQEVLHKL